ncbi:Exosome complex component CSL4 [Blattella germanica]|nr:Exosome complex component CSL4 [Blattella germanica]
MEELVCIPGQRLSLADKEHISGCGTYERNGYIYSTLAGSCIIEVHSSKEQTIVPAPGDIVTAKLPLTEVHTYPLSTAENELGVVIAHSEAGATMVPVSWTEMQCPKTYVKELRKVAKIIPESAAAATATSE